MKVLFLDDSENRHADFDGKYVSPDAEVWHVRTVREAIARLRASSPFDIVCLDHDLGGEGHERKTVSAESCVEDGCRVARFILTMPPALRPRQVVSHSFNHAGRAEIVSILGQVVPVLAVPFTTYTVEATGIRLR